jgi:hypothetical protein
MTGSSARLVVASVIAGEGRHVEVHSPAVQQARDRDDVGAVPTSNGTIDVAGSFDRRSRLTRGCEVYERRH